MTHRTELIAAYLRTIDTSNKVDRWAYEQVLEICTSRPEEAVGLTIALIEACDTDLELGYVVAGPLEDILWRGNEASLSAIASVCDTAPKVLRAVSMLAWREDDPMYGPWKELLAKHGIKIRAGA